MLFKFFQKGRKGPRCAPKLHLLATVCQQKLSHDQHVIRSLEHMAHIYNFLQKNHFENSSHKKFGSIFSNGTSNQPTKRGHTFSKQSAATASEYAHVEIGVAGGGAKFTSQSFFKFEHQGSGQRTWKNSFEKKFGTNQKKKNEGKLEIFRVFFPLLLVTQDPVGGYFLGEGWEKSTATTRFQRFSHRDWMAKRKNFEASTNQRSRIFFVYSFFFLSSFPNGSPRNFIFFFHFFPCPLHHTGVPPKTDDLTVAT